MGETSSAVVAGPGRERAAGADSGSDRAVTTVLEIDGPVDGETLRSALNYVADKHPAIWCGPDGVPRQAGPVPLRVTRCSDGPAESCREEALSVAAGEICRPFDITTPPLLRGHLIDFAPTRHLFVLAMDPSVGDAHSVNLVTDEVVAAAHRLATGRTLPDTPPDGYREIRRARTEWLSGEVGTAATARRRAALAGSSHVWPLASQPDRADPAELLELRQDLPEDATASLFRCARGCGSTPFSLALAALAVAFGHRQPDGALAVLSTFVSRETEADERVVGRLSTDVAIRVPPVAGTLAGYLRELRRELMLALNDQKVPADLVLPRVSDRAGLTVSLMYLPAQLRGADRPAARIGAALVERGRGSLCPTGADVDLFVLDDSSLRHPADRLCLGGFAGRHRVGERQLSSLLGTWAATLARLAELDPTNDLLPPTPPCLVGPGLDTPSEERRDD